MSDQNSYFEYLRKRSRLGWLYRRFWLYPRLARHLRGRVLDVGCGIGDMLRCRPNTVGVDINPDFVGWCNGLGLQVHQMQPDVLPFPEAEFDGVILDNVLEHLSDPQPLLCEIRRVLSPGGVFLVGVPGICGYGSDPDHKVFYDEKALMKVVTTAGFSSKHVLYMPVRLHWLDRMMRQYCLYGVFGRD